MVTVTVILSTNGSKSVVSGVMNETCFFGCINADVGMTNEARITKVHNIFIEFFLIIYPPKDRLFLVSYIDIASI
jgi:hypothetical protein